VLAQIRNNLVDSGETFVLFVTLQGHWPSNLSDTERRDHLTEVLSGHSHEQLTNGRV